MHDFISPLENALTTIKNAMSKMVHTFSSSSDAGGHDEDVEAHEDDASTTNPLPGLTGEASKVDKAIDALEDEQADLLEERRRLTELMRGIPEPGIPAVQAQIDAIDARLAQIQTELDNNGVLLDAEFANIHNDTVADLEAQLANLPSHPAFSAQRLQLEQEIQHRNDLFAAGITEPYLLDELIAMSNSSDPLVSNTFDRILNGDVTVFSFSEQEASLEDALAFDPDFDPRTEIALHRPPPREDEIMIKRRTVGGLSLGDSGNILIKDGSGRIEEVLIHEVNHALNHDGKYDYYDEKVHTTKDSRQAIGSFTTEVRAYNVDNRYASDASATASSVSAAHPSADRTAMILTDLGYDPKNLTGNQVHIKEVVDQVVAGFPSPPNPLNADQVAQLERIYIADHVLDHDVIPDDKNTPTYDEAVEQYNATDTVRDTINDIILNGAGGIEDNGPPPPADEGGS